MSPLSGTADAVSAGYVRRLVSRYGDCSGRPAGWSGWGESFVIALQTRYTSGLVIGCRGIVTLAKKPAIPARSPHAVKLTNRPRDGCIPRLAARRIGPVAQLRCSAIDIAMRIAA